MLSVSWADAVPAAWPQHGPAVLRLRQRVRLALGTQTPRGLVSCGLSLRTPPSPPASLPRLQAYIGFPVSFGMSAMDPGFTMVPIFELTPE